MSAPAHRGRPRSRFALLLAAAGVAAAFGWLCLARVPPGCLGVVPGEPGATLEPGLHLKRPFAGVSLYPQSAFELRRSASALTSEGARVALEYTLRAAVDPVLAGRLPPRTRSGPPAEAFPEEVAALAERTLASPPREPGEPIEARLRRGLEDVGLRVESLTVTAAVQAAARAGRAQRLAHPIVLVGLDGADWQILDPLIQAGRLPHLARLRSRSVWGHMRSFEPILSPLLWTTAATGKPPEEHGIIDFLVPDPATGRKVPITSRSRRVRALWNIFTQRGLTSDVIAWWASWPAEPIEGRVVSDRVAYSLFEVDAASEGLTYPASLWGSLREEAVSDAQIGYEEVARFVDVSRPEFEAARRRAREKPEEAYREPVNHLTKILASTRTYHRIALKLLADGQPDLFAVYYQGIDEVSHRFAHFMPPRMTSISEADFRRYKRAVAEFCVFQDELLGQLLAAVDPDSSLMVMSDHGFHNGSSRPTDGPADIEGKPGKWHRLYGIVMVAGAGVEPGRLDTASLYDVAPTILSLAGLPQAADMKGRPLLRRASAGTRPETVATYETSGPAAAGGGDPSEARLSEADDELLRNLASLGYIGSSAPGPSEPAAEPQQPGTVTSHSNLAALLLRKGDLAGAEAELRRALSLRPSYFPALMSLGQVLVRQGRVPEALSATRLAVAGAKDAEPGAYVQLALLAARAGESSQAAKYLEGLGEHRPRNAGIEAALGVLAAHEGRLQAAEAHFRAALSIDPASPEAMGRLFQLRREQGTEAELEADVRRALSLDDKSVMHHNWLGLILARRGDIRGAEREYWRALDLAPDFGGTMANLGSLYGRAGKLEEAVAVLSRALRIDPRNLEASVNLGAALAKLGRLDEAIESLERARSMGIRSPDLLNAVGLAYAQTGRTGQAIEALEESLTLSPDQPQVRALLSELTRPAG